MSGEVKAHTLYRFFDATGALLYVGRTVAPARRWREHEKTKAWFDDVATVTREVLATAEAVDRAERAAIADESPIHNIMLNGARRPPVPKPLKPKLPVDVDHDLATRWASICSMQPDEKGVVHVKTYMECEGEETFCECPDCHQLRMEQIQNLRDGYEWHPEIVAAVDAVERSYLDGHDLTDWYYDLDDIAMFWRMRLVEQSQSKPLVCLASIDDAVATIGCPFCLGTHRHFLQAGMALDHPLTAGCASFGGGRYVLIEDVLTFMDRERSWPTGRAA